MNGYQEKPEEAEDQHSGADETEDSSAPENEPNRASLAGTKDFDNQAEDNSEETERRDLPPIPPARVRWMTVFQFISLITVIYLFYWYLFERAHDGPIVKEEYEDLKFLALTILFVWSLLFFKAYLAIRRDDRRRAERKSATQD